MKTELVIKQCLGLWEPGPTIYFSSICIPFFLPLRHSRLHSVSSLWHSDRFRCLHSTPPVYIKLVKDFVVHTLTLAVSLLCFETSYFKMSNTHAVAASVPQAEYSSACQMHDMVTL